MKRDEFDRLLDDFLDGELDQEGMDLFDKACAGDEELAAQADGLKRVEDAMQEQFSPIREAQAPDRDYATRIVSRLRMEKETARQKQEDKQIVPWFGWRLVTVAGYTFVVILFSVLATMQYVVPKLVEQGQERIIASVQAESESIRAAADSYYEEKTGEADKMIREAKDMTAPDVAQPSVIIGPEGWEYVKDRGTDPQTAEGDPEMEQPYFKADAEMFGALWGLDAEDIPEDESSADEDTEETE